MRKCLAERAPLAGLAPGAQCECLSRDITLLSERARGDVWCTTLVIAQLLYPYAHATPTRHGVLWASRPRRTTSCGSGLSLRSEVYYFSAPNIAYFTVYSMTRAHDSVTRTRPSELSHRERPHASAQHAAATCSTPLLPLTTCGPAGSRPTVTSERATRLPHRKGRHTAASSRSGHSDLPAPLLPAPRQDPPTRLVRVAPAAHTRHLGLGLVL